MRDRAASRTPEPLRDVLLDMARSVRQDSCICGTDPLGNHDPACPHAFYPTAPLCGGNVSGPVGAA